jgi:hypothetical protein
MNVQSVASQVQKEITNYVVIQWGGRHICSLPKMQPREETANISEKNIKSVSHINFMYLFLFIYGLVSNTKYFRLYNLE